MKRLVTPGVEIGKIEQEMEECFKLSVEFIINNVYLKALCFFP